MKNSKKTVLSSLWECLLVMLCMHTSFCFGQDTLVKKSGQEIICQVKEVSPTEIRYTRIEMENGPVYIEDRFSVEKIKYKNGFVEVFPVIEPWKIPITRPKPKEEEVKQVDYALKPVFKKINHGYLYWDRYVGEREMQNIAKGLKDPAINEEIKAARWAKGLQYIGFLAIPIFMAQINYDVNNFSVWQGQSKAYQNANLAFIGAGALVIGASIYFKVDRGKRNANIVRLYNQHYQ